MYNPGVRRRPGHLVVLPREEGRLLEGGRGEEDAPARAERRPAHGGGGDAERWAGQGGAPAAAPAAGALAAAAAGVAERCGQGVAAGFGDAVAVCWRELGKGLRRGVSGAGAKSTGNQNFGAWSRAYNPL